MAIAAPLSMMSSYLVALSAGAKAAHRANTASPPTIPKASFQAASTRVTRQVSHNIAMDRRSHGYAASAGWRLRPARARKISSSVASRDSTTSPPSARTE